TSSESVITSLGGFEVAFAFPLVERFSGLGLGSRNVLLLLALSCKAPVFVMVPSKVVVLALGTCKVPALVTPLSVVLLSDVNNPSPFSVPPVTVTPPSRVTLDPLPAVMVPLPVLVNVPPSSASDPPPVASSSPVLEKVASGSIVSVFPWADAVASMVL